VVGEVRKVAGTVGPKLTQRSTQSSQLQGTCFAFRCTVYVAMRTLAMLLAVSIRSSQAKILVQKISLGLHDDRSFTSDRAK
jgi:hypothetical protein